MAEEVQAIVKLQIPVGKATPAPSVDTALGPHGVNIMQFIKESDAKTQDQMGTIIPVVMTVYQDRPFTSITKTPPAPIPTKKELGLNPASRESNKTKAGQLTKEQVKKIAETKMPDLNAANLESAISMIKGTARSMEVTVKE